MPAIVLLAAVVLVISIGGGVAVTAMPRSKFLALIGTEFARQLSELRPSMTEAERRKAGAIVAAQAALETGYGKAPAWVQGWNFGNVTAGSSWTGPVVEAGDTEPDQSGKMRPIRARFRKYPDLRSAVSDFVRLLSWSRYRPARDALFRGDAAGYVKALRDDDPATSTIEGGYFTAPLAHYQGSVARILPEAERALS